MTGLSLSGILGLYLCVLLACLSTLQALRSETPSSRQDRSTTFLRRAGTKSFPQPLLSEWIYPELGQLPAFLVEHFPFEAFSAA